MTTANSTLNIKATHCVYYNLGEKGWSPGDRQKWAGIKKEGSDNETGDGEGKGNPLPTIFILHFFLSFCNLKSILYLPS